MTRLAICCIIKNEAPYLQEWITYHRLIGFDMIYLYDNGSADYPQSRIAKEIQDGWVSLIPWPIVPGQLAAYDHFIKMFAKDYDWIAFIDLDEFVRPLGALQLKPFLNQVGLFSGILLNWQVFGPSGHNQPPGGLVIEEFKHRLPDHFPVNKHVKSIVRGKCVMGPGHTPHVFALHGGVCNADGHEVQNIPIGGEPCYNNFVINHYFTKSYTEWREKVARGKADTVDETQAYKDGVFAHLRDCATQIDNGMDEYAALVRAKLL